LIEVLESKCIIKIEINEIILENSLSSGDNVGDVLQQQSLHERPIVPIVRKVMLGLAVAWLRWWAPLVGGCHNGL